MCSCTRAAGAGSVTQKGSAYDFLLSLGYSETQAREELERLAGVASSWASLVRPRVAYTPPNPLEQTRGALSRCASLTPDELAKVTRLLSPLTEQDQAAQNLQARGLLGWEGLQVGTLRRTFQTREGKVLACAGALGFLLTGPDGNAWGLKVRNLGGSGGRPLRIPDRWTRCARMVQPGLRAGGSPAYH